MGFKVTLDAMPFAYACDMLTVSQAIKTYPEQLSYSAWKEVYLLPTSRCVSPNRIDDTRLTSASLVALTTESGLYTFRRHHQ